MHKYPVIQIVNNQPCFDEPIEKILEDCEIGGALQILNADEFYTDRQRKWWKGVLLPSLAKDSGDTVVWWETKLKLAVLPDDFQPIYVAVGKQIFPIIPSINILSKRKMNILIEGSVEKCHEWGFDWVTLPDENLRR